MDAYVKDDDDYFIGRGGRDESSSPQNKNNLKQKDKQPKKMNKQKGDEKAAVPRKAKFSNRAAPSKIGIKVKQYGSKYHGGGDPGIGDGGDGD